MANSLNSLDRIFAAPTADQPVNYDEIKKNLKDKCFSSPAVTSLIQTWMSGNGGTVRINRTPNENFWSVKNSQGETIVNPAFAKDQCSLWNRFKHGWNMLTDKEYKTKFDSAIDSLVGAVQQFETDQAAAREAAEAENAAAAQAAAVARQQHIRGLIENVNNLTQEVAVLEGQSQELNARKTALSESIQQKKDQNTADRTTLTNSDSELAKRQLRKDLFNQLLERRIDVFDDSDENLLQQFMDSRPLLGKNKDEVRELVRIDRSLGANFGNHKPEAIAIQNAFNRFYQQVVDSRTTLTNNIAAREQEITQGEEDLVQLNIEIETNRNTHREKQTALQNAQEELRLAEEHPAGPAA